MEKSRIRPSPKKKDQEEAPGINTIPHTDKPGKSDGLMTEDVERQERQEEEKIPERKKKRKRNTDEEVVPIQLRSNPPPD